eukprot:GHVU01046659.1.p1 GENE.GHVU01046659.1~~GHVU01046659.1.p1  ORF type:complete len:235 (+),score=49.34 GHVU01046659.1:251-955(+)
MHRVTNQRPGVPPAETVLVTTHGLTMRLILMQLQGWSPNTFHTVWNAGNCEIYVLELQLSRPGFSPYVINETAGDQLRSTADVLCHFKPSPSPPPTRTRTATPPPPPTTAPPQQQQQQQQESQQQLAQQESQLAEEGQAAAPSSPSSPPRLLPLHNYLSLPPPRTSQSSLALEMIAEQHSLDPAMLSHLEFRRMGWSKEYGMDHSTSKPNDGPNEDQEEEEEPDQHDQQDQRQR